MSSIQALRNILKQSTTGEYIAADAPHWALEPYIPMATDDLQQCLLDRDELTAVQQAGYIEFGGVLSPVLHHYGRRGQSEMNRQYVSIDPDNEALRNSEPNDQSDAIDTINAAAKSCTGSIREVLLAANYTPLSREGIEAAVGVASQWGVPLHVDFNVFKQLAVYTRGDIMGVRTLRCWNRPWREDLVDVPIFQRVVVVFQLNDDYNTGDELDPQRLHLRLFKNIPKLDVDMLLPGTRVRISWIDRTRIVVPSLGGIGMTIWKIVRTALLVAALSVYTAAILLGLVLAAVGYIVKSVLNYFQTRNRYMLNLTRSLYHQKLGTNAGVIYRLREEAQQQRYREIMLTYFAMLSHGSTISRRRLKRRVERILRESIQLEIDFDIDKTIALMESFELCEQLADGKYRWSEPQQAIKKLHQWWDDEPLAVEAPVRNP